MIDAEVVWLGLDGVPDFDALHSRANAFILTIASVLAAATRLGDQAKIANEN